MALLLDCLDSLTWEDSAPPKWRTWARVREVNCFVEIFERVQTKSFVVTRCMLYAMVALAPLRMICF